MTRVGFVGLGSQGGPMARRIVDAGYPTTLWARRPETLEPFADTAATIAATPAELGAASDVLVRLRRRRRRRRRRPARPRRRARDAWPTAPSSSCTAPCIPPPASGSRTTSRAAHRRRAGERRRPQGGRRRAARDGRRRRADASTAADRSSRPSADPVLHVGPLGAGQEAKLLNNTVFTAQLALAAEVFELAAARQLDQQAVATILANGSGRSYAAEVVAGGGFNLDGLAAVAGDAARQGRRDPRRRTPT